MSFVERVNQGESLASWLNWLTEPPAVSWSVIMGHLSAIWEGGIWTHPNAFRTGQRSCAVHSMATLCTSHARKLNFIYLNDYYLYKMAYCCYGYNVRDGKSYIYIPTYKWRNSNVIITANVIATLFWRNGGVIVTLSVRRGWYTEPQYYDV